MCNVQLSCSNPTTVSPLPILIVKEHTKKLILKSFGYILSFSSSFSQCVSVPLSKTLNHHLLRQHSVFHTYLVGMMNGSSRCSSMRAIDLFPAQERIAYGCTCVRLKLMFHAEQKTTYLNTPLKDNQALLHIWTTHHTSS